MKNATESRSAGFDAGNYGNAYESQDWDSWCAEHCTPPAGVDSVAYAEGMLLGFFSSYEVSEISDPDAAEMVESLRAQFPDFD